MHLTWTEDDGTMRLDASTSVRSHKFVIRADHEFMRESATNFKFDVPTFYESRYQEDAWV